MQIPFNEYDEYRRSTRGKYYTDFSFLNGNCPFPNLDSLHRDRMSKVRLMQYSGDYQDLISLIFRVGDTEHSIPLAPIRIPIYKLATNKTVDLIFQTPPIIRTGDSSKDKELNKIIERYGVLKAFKDACAYSHIFGYCGLRVNKFGVNAVLPIYIDKIVSPHDNTLDRGVFISEPLKDRTGKLRWLRVEVHINGWIFEKVFECEYAFPGYKLGRSIEYRYNNRFSRVIPAGGKWYKTGVEDDTLLHMCTYNDIEDKVYGQSDYTAYEDEVIVNEQRLTVVNSILNGLKDPYLLIGASMTVPVKDKKNEVELKTVRDETGSKKFIVVNDKSEGSTFIPQTLQHEYKLDNNMQMLDYVEHLLYMTTEMSKPFLLGEFNGSAISTESLKSLIKPAMDKAGRLEDSLYYAMRNCIYDLGRLNGIDLIKDDITIKFNIGTTLDFKSAVDVLQKATTGKQVLSDEYLLEALFDIDADQAQVMREQLNRENVMNNALKDIDTDPLNNGDSEDINNENNNKEDNNNETERLS